MGKLPLIIPVFLITCFILAATPCSAEAPEEFEVKAGFLLNIPMFADWPNTSGAAGTFTIGIMGETPLRSLLETMVNGKRIKSRPVAIIRLDEISQLDSCHVLFIAASERYRLQRLLPEAHRRGIMTISDMRDFVKLGGMVSLVTVNNRITYNLNLAAARAAAISFSSQLLKLANDISN